MTCEPSALQVWGWLGLGFLWGFGARQVLLWLRGATEKTRALEMLQCAHGEWFWQCTFGCARR